ncbi:chorismate mutase [Lentilactobacillus curieae]|uniref:Chorismate mutase n=1 Tax=Lentilactobacillus curieae TaxID=1138822 RepID=A0A1S6QGD7_9LACO|nr:chorismate mutase [Lentilactobacillus curieae]AQW20659.1 chorismate mutase [Lentilactobacillus curieae]
MTDLEQLRWQIDQTDKEIAELLKERFDFTAMIAAVKDRDGIPTLNSQREDVVLTKVTENLRDPQVGKAITEIFKKIMDESKKQQNQLLNRVGEAK